MVESVHASKVLIIFFSLSGQTKGLLENLADGLKESGAMVAWERLEPEVRLRFPLGSFAKTILMMLTTFFRQRVPIKPLSVSRTAGFDLCILAGPTWSYNPSGPVLAFLDRDGNPLLQGRMVLPLISCRGYWRLHWFGLRRLLKKCGAAVPNCLVFSHPHREPWRTLGVFLQIAGKPLSRSTFWGRFYKRYGHSERQFEEARKLGVELGQALAAGTPLETLNLRNKIALNLH